MHRVTVLLGVMGVALGVALAAAPLALRTHGDPQHDTTAAEKFVSSASRLVARFRNITAERESKGLNLLSVLHILGYSNEDLLNVVHKVENATEELYKIFTEEEQLMLENSGIDLLIMINNADFQLDAALEDLATIKSVVYPHLNSNQQQFWDGAEMCISHILKYFH